MNQSKDIASIGSHVSQFSSQIESLKSELTAERKKNKEASSRIASTKKEAAVERETSASLKRQYEAKLKVSACSSVTFKMLFWWEYNDFIQFIENTCIYSFSCLMWDWMQ